MATPEKICVAPHQIFDYDLEIQEVGHNGAEEYIRKDALIEWINAQQEKLWELLPDADNDNPTQMELRYLGQYMQLEAMEDKINEM